MTGVKRQHDAAQSAHSILSPCCLLMLIAGPDSRRLPDSTLTVTSHTLRTTQSQRRRAHHCSFSTGYWFWTTAVCTARMQLVLSSKAWANTARHTADEAARACDGTHNASAAVDRCSP